jgi:hypothetical protein
MLKSLDPCLRTTIASTAVVWNLTQQGLCCVDDYGDHFFQANRHMTLHQEFRRIKMTEKLKLNKEQVCSAFIRNPQNAVGQVYFPDCLSLDHMCPPKMSVSEGGSISIMPVGGCLPVNTSPNAAVLRLIDAGSDGAGDGDGPEQPEGGQALPRD